MFKKNINHIPTFIAGDLTLIKEVMHPKNDGVSVPPRYSLAYAVVAVGKASLPHILTKNSELYIFLEGKGQIFIGDESSFVSKGDVVLVPIGVQQWVRNTGKKPLKFYVIVSPPWSKEAE